MKNVESDNNDIISEIKPKSTNETWIIIGGEKKWTRKCPDCSKLLYYSHKSGLYRSQKRNCKCSSCERTFRYNNTDAAIKISNTLQRREFSDSHRKKLSEKLKGENNAMFGKTGNLNPFYGKKHSLKTKKLIGKLSTKTNTGRQHSSDTIKKWRLLAISRKQKLGIFDNQPYYNPIACHLIDSYGKKHGYNFQHAMNGGEYYIVELGYWVDGYDKNNNTIFEYNEPHHYDLHGNLKRKDVRRFGEIKKLLNCKIIVYNGTLKQIEML